MQHIAGKLSTSSFQRYKVCMNRSSDERVMAPGSRGIGAVFVHFSGEDSDQTGDAFGEPRVPRRSWSRYLSNAPGLVDQLVASRKDSAREGGCPGGKNAFSSQRVFLQILSQFAHIFDLAPDVRFSTFLVPSESLRCLLLQGSGFAEIRAWTCEIWFREQRPPGVFLVRLRAVFRSGFRLDPIKSWRSESSTSCMSVSSFQRTRACGSTCCESGRLCAQAWQRRWESSGIFSTALFRRPVFTRVVDVAPDVGFRRSCFDHNFLVSRPFWARKVSNRSSHYVLQNGQGSGQFDSVFRSGQQSGQTLVKLGRIWSKLSKLWEMYPGPRFEGFWARWTLVGLGTARSNLGQTSVNPGFVGSCRAWVPGRPVLRADTRENPGEGHRLMVCIVVRAASPQNETGVKAALGIQDLKRFLGQHFEMKDLGPLTRITDNKIVDTPIEYNNRLNTHDGEPLPNATFYRQLVGSLVYLTITRLDISYAVHIVSQFMAAPRFLHYAAILRILRLILMPIGQGTLSDRRSTTGTEAEYRALADTTAELLWLRWLLQDLGIDCSTAVPIHCDNRSAIQIAHNDVFHERTKHIEIDCHFVHHHLLQGTLQLRSVSSQDQLADIFTKPYAFRPFL
uniref:Reverse transcriptase Ty1/copia-type domain-containing protein n=1 Tax=Fagus sylvatica TaxID=28930 RepID=A0A2N9J6E8_FAGSY